MYAGRQLSVVNNFNVTCDICKTVDSNRASAATVLQVREYVRIPLFQRSSAGNEYKRAAGPLRSWPRFSHGRQEWSGHMGGRCWFLPQLRPGNKLLELLELLAKAGAFSAGKKLGLFGGGLHSSQLFI
jgi:hypothetical protein